MTQIPLEFDHRPSLGGEDFLVAPSNEAAVAWLDRWPDWPAPALAVYGPLGCGKTHLAHVWRARSGAVLLTPDALATAEPPRLLGSAKACILDGFVQDRLRSLDERRLLHLYNLLAEQGGHLLLCADEAPARWPIALADLRSRLTAIPAVRVEPPDDLLIGALLVKLFSDRQLLVGSDVITYLCTHIERSFEAARSIVAAIDRAALAAHRRVTVPLVRELLARGDISEG
ncbi:HdaA/DnaA family protein [Rhodospirillaceae bacterium SYSU D60014]|uniref:HdaA/DnaA family protein n=1 Tax=Virgifigura deserti TaxID=2268457 RepID=UPI000E66A5CF